MAHLKNLDAFTFDQAQWAALRSSAVGNNRTVTLTPEGELQCRLHGHKVASFKQGKDGLEVTLDTCGWLTVTTMAAMGGFMGAMGIRGSTRRAKGTFGARWYVGEGQPGTDQWGFMDADSPDNRRISFVVPWGALKGR